MIGKIHSMLSLPYSIKRHTDSTPGPSRYPAGKAIGRFLAGAGLMLMLFLPAPVQAGLKSANAAYKRGDYQAAFIEFKRLAEKGNAKAQCMLGTMYDEGAGVYPEAAEAFKWYFYAAQKGEPIAQFMVAQMYYEGKAGPADYREAALWYRKAATKGHVHAQYNMGILYEIGRGVVQDKAEALKWYLRAAEHGVGEAQWKVGLFYAEGIGISQDLIRAYAWLDCSDRRGIVQARSIRDTIAQKISPQDLSRARELTKKLELR